MRPLILQRRFSCRHLRRRGKSQNAGGLCSRRHCRHPGVLRRTKPRRKPQIVPQIAFHCRHTTPRGKSRRKPRTANRFIVDVPSGSKPSQPISYIVRHEQQNSKQIGKIVSLTTREVPMISLKLMLCSMFYRVTRHKIFGPGPGRRNLSPASRPVRSLRVGVWR